MRNRMILVSAALLALGSCATPVQKASLSIKGIAFSVEVARTDEERARGLMFRSSLGKREGMLFVFDRDEHLTFWMKDTRIPLTIGFLSMEGKILEIVDMDPYSEKTIRSRLSSRYALELPRGTFGEIGAVEGDYVVFPPGFK